MDVEPSTTFAALTLGFLLGLKHATDADHIVAVSVIAGESRSIWRGIWIGCSWGLGHTTPLLILGVIILTFRSLINGYESIAPVFEFGVGIMLILLGIQVFWNLKRGRLHVHEHSHDNGPHVHIHATHDPTASPYVESEHGFFHFGKPVFRIKSYAIGVIHGLAGSAAIMLLLLPTLPSFWVGLGYIILFGVGTILSMAVITVLLGIPFALAGDLGKASRLVSTLAGSISVVFGVALVSDLVLNTTFIPF